MFKYLHFAKWKLDKLEMTTKTALDLPQVKMYDMSAKEMAINKFNRIGL